MYAELKMLNLLVADLRYGREQHHWLVDTSSDRVYKRLDMGPFDRSAVCFGGLCCNWPYQILLLIHSGFVSWLFFVPIFSGAGSFPT